MGLSTCNLNMLAAFTLVRAMDLDRSRPGGLAPHRMAREIGIQTFQIRNLYDGEPVGTRAEDKLLAYHDLTREAVERLPEPFAPEVGLSVIRGWNSPKRISHDLTLKG